MNGTGRFRVAVLGLIIAAMLGALVPSAGAAITAPVATPGGATEVFGSVPINDPYVNTANTARSCTASSSSGVTSKGITKVEIFQGPTATGTPVLANNFTSHLKGTFAFFFPFENFGLAGTMAPSWNTDTTTNGVAPRGLYTIKTSYFARATTTGACQSSANCIASTTFGTLQVNSGGVNLAGCAPNAAVGTPDLSQPASTVLVDVQNRLNLAITNAPASGPFLITDSGPTAQVVNVRLTDPGRSNAGIANTAVTVTLAGKPGGGDDVRNLTTDSGGNATTTFDMAADGGWEFGNHTLTVTGPASTPLFRGPTPVVNAIKYGGRSKTTYTGQTSVYWNESLAASARVEALVAGGGHPTDGNVRFTLGSQTPVTGAVNNDGDASATIAPVTSNPPSAVLKSDFLPSDTSDFLNSSTTSTITINKRPTTIVYDGPTEVRWGDPVTLSAVLTDDRLSTPGSPVGVAGEMITFSFGTQTATAGPTDINGRASTNISVDAEVGDYPASASYAGDEHYVASTSAVTAVHITERYVFEDSLSTGEIHLNPGTQQFKYEDPAKGTASGDRKAPLMLSIFLPVDLVWPGLPTLPVIPDNPLENLDNSPTLEPTISFKTISDLIAFLVGAVPASDEVTLSSTESSSTGGTGSGSTSGAQSNTSAIEITDPHVAQPDDVATNPIPIGGFTIRQLLEKLTSGNYPSDLDTCQLLAGSTCERRLVVLAYPTESGLTTVGVFDIRTGLFLALNDLTGDGTRLMLDLGGCLNLDICLRLPSTPTGLPDLLSAIPGLPVIPTDFFQPLPTLAPGSLIVPLSDLPPLGDVVVPTELPGTGVPVVGDPVDLILGAAEPLGLGDLGLPLPDLSDPAGALGDLGVPLEDITVPLGELLGLPPLNDTIINIAIADLNAQLAPLTADLPATLDGAINDALADNGVPDTAALAALVDETLALAGLGGGIPSLDSIEINPLVAPVTEPVLEALGPAIDPVLEQLGLSPIELSSDSSTASTAGASTSAIPVPAPGGTLSPVNDVFTLLGLPTEAEVPDLAEQLVPVNDAVNDLDTSALAIPELEEQLQPINDAINTINEAAGSEVIPPIEVPGLPTLPDTDTLAGLLMEQVNLAAANLQTTPERILNLVLDFYVPTPAEVGTYVTGTLQQVIDRLTGNAVIGGDNSGILGLPEVAIGEITHLVVDLMSTACESGGTTAAPDATNWKLLTTSCAPSGSQIDVVQSCKTSPTVKRADCPSADRTRPFEYHENNTIAQYTISRSPYVPAVPGILGLNPLIIALPLALGLSPVDAPAPVLDLISPLAAAPLLLTTLGPSKLINVQGDGWTDATGSHGAGNQVVGQSVDTHPKATSPTDPFPIYLPFYNGSLLTAEPDHAIDFIGFGEPLVNTHTCLNTFEKEEQVNGKWMSTYRGGAGGFVFGSWIGIGFCTSILTMATSVGIATFNGSPVDFKNDLAPLWSPVPPGADVAITLMVNTLEGILPADLLTGALGLLGAVPGLPTIPGVPAVPGIPEVPGVPEVPTVP